MEEEQEVDQDQEEEQEEEEEEEEDEEENDGEEEVEHSEEEKKNEDLFESSEENIYYLRRRQANIMNQICEIPCIIRGMVCSSVVYKNNYVFMGTSGNCVYCYNLETRVTSQLTHDFNDWVLSLEIMTLNGVDLLAAGGGLYDRSICFYDLTNISIRVIPLITQK